MIFFLETSSDVQVRPSKTLCDVWGRRDVWKCNGNLQDSLVEGAAEVSFHDGNLYEDSRRPGGHTARVAHHPWGLLKIFSGNSYQSSAKKNMRSQTKVAVGPCCGCMFYTSPSGPGWSFVFCFVFMTCWAMMLVEFVHPLVLQMHKDKIMDCPECTRATSSIMEANLLLFKTVIAGDSWGKVAVPVIQYSPATAIIFCGALMTTVFGVLNMVIAVPRLAILKIPSPKNFLVFLAKQVFPDSI